MIPMGCWECISKTYRYRLTRLTSTIGHLATGNKVLILIQPWSLISVSALDSMEICLLVTSPDNCIDSICKRIWVWQSSLFVPNAMAPEQVFSNDDQYFLPKGFGLAAYELRIYDKWGNEVFFSDSISSTYYSPAVGWDGNDQRTGKPAPMGVYAWNISATFRDGTRWTGHLNTNGRRLTYGTLTLLRW